jgi:uncharacterized RDD family membrane protein YckC
MQIYVGRNGKQLGPFTLDEVQEKLEDGDVRLSDLGWREGMKDWVPLRQMLKGYVAEDEADSRPLSQLDPAPNGSRFVAAFIDGAVLMISGMIIGGVFGAVLGGIMGANGATVEQIQESVQLPANALGILIGWLYMAIQESSASGATIGKKAMGLRVINLNGDQISFLRATGRHFSRILCFLTIFIGYLLILFNDQRQGLHDMLASTRVVKA